VKEGSPYEEDYLIDALKEEIKVTDQDKEEVKELMKVLLQFAMIDESTLIHGLLEQMMKA